VTTIRKATPADSFAAAELILMAGSPTAEYLFNDALQEGVAVVRHMFEHPQHLISFDLAWVAEEDGEVAALMQGFPGCKERRLTLSTLGLVPSMLRSISLHTALRVIWRARRFSVPLKWSKERDHFLVNVLAVYERFRRRGIATLLLEIAEKEARCLGLPKLRLVVRADNAPAIAAYRNFGFIMLDEVEHSLRLGKDQCVLWRPMEKKLP